MAETACKRVDCRAWHAWMDGKDIKPVCDAVMDTSSFQEYCPFFKTVAQYEAERERLARMGHRIEYIQPKPTKK